MATIKIPTPLRKYTDQKREFETGSDELSDALRDLIEKYPEVEDNLLDEEGNVRSYIKVYIGDKEISSGTNGSVKLDEETEISLVPAIAGGWTELKQ